MNVSLRLEPKTTAGVEHLLTAKQVAEILGVRQKRIYELGIPAVHVSERQLRWRPRPPRQQFERRVGRDHGGPELRPARAGPAGQKWL